MDKKIVLASTSPRRREILAKLRIPFEAEDSGYEEDMTLDMPPIELGRYLSLGKAKSSAERHKNAIIIASDTFVVFENHKLGKPKDEEDARIMLQMLSGKENQIITTVTIIDAETGKTKTFHDTIRVFFDDLSPETIDAYIKTGEPMDKAGAYALQELGALLIDRIEGDFYTAMGLPLKKTAEALREFGVQIL